MWSCNCGSCPVSVGVIRSCCWEDKVLLGRGTRTRRQDGLAGQMSLASQISFPRETAQMGLEALAGPRMSVPLHSNLRPAVQGQAMDFGTREF